MRWIGSVTQPGNDATVIQTFKTNLPEGFGIKLAYVRIWFNRLPTYFWATGINDISFDASVTSDQSSIVAHWSQVITANAAAVRTSTTIIVEKEWTLPDFTPVIVDSSFTVALLSDGTAQSNTLNYFIEYRLVPISEMEYIQIASGGI